MAPAPRASAGVVLTEGPDGRPVLLATAAAAGALEVAVIDPLEPDHEDDG